MNDPINPPKPIDRREFVKSVSTAGIGLAIGNSLASAQTSASSGVKRRRYAIVGTGSRHEMYRDGDRPPIQRTCGTRGTVRYQLRPGRAFPQPRG